MAGDTIKCIEGSTFNVEGQILGENDAPFDYTGAELGIYETHNITQSEIQANTVDAALGKFTVSITDAESLKMPEGRNSWFKLSILYPDPDPQRLVFPPIWIDIT
jgi:hypothetical protein